MCQQEENASRVISHQLAHRLFPSEMTEEIRLSIFDLCVARNAGLLALMSVLSQSFFTLVRRHFMSFSFLSARHRFKILN